MRRREATTTQVELERVESGGRIRGRRRIHCSYHKCLTVYFERVFDRLYRSPFGPRGDYRHFDSRVDEFERDVEAYAVASLNNHALDLDRFDDVRVTRFVRDPRDLVVSGYFYHRRAAEVWCQTVSPCDADWRVVNGSVPGALREGDSFSTYLARVSLEEGLLAELEFRRRHFESMRAWPVDDPRVRLFRYEEVLGDEVAVFDRIFRFFELPGLARTIGRVYARRFRAASMEARGEHIRDVRSQQWRAVFPPSVARRFDDEYGDLVERLGYPRR